MSISEQVKELRAIANNLSIGHNMPISLAVERFREAADTIEALSAKLADMERSSEDCGGGWIYCGDGKNLPEPGRRYRVTALWKDGDFETRSVYDLVYGTDGLWHGKNYTPVSFEIIAWKPLEEPYRENIEEHVRKSILGVAQMSDKAWAAYRKEQRTIRRNKRK